MAEGRQTRARSAVEQWAVDRLVALATKAADHLLWLAVIALVAGGAGAALLKALAKHAWLVRGVLYVAVAILVFAFLVGVVKRLFDRRAATRAEHDRARRDALFSEAQRGLLYNALESVQMAVGMDEPWDIDALVERGILGPVRGLLVRTELEDVRLAVLVPDDGGDHFTMRWTAGHRPESVSKFKRPIDSMLAGQAYRNGEFKVTANAAAEPSFIRNPNATRDFAALVAVPLRIQDRIVGVLSVVSTEIDAFTESDISFIKTIGALVDVILAIERDATVILPRLLHEERARGRLEALTEAHQPAEPDGDSASHE
jgi:transcriptional regulator with GAF, ATPase, and Fis domain